MQKKNGFFKREAYNRGGKKQTKGGKKEGINLRGLGLK